VNQWTSFDPSVNAHLRQLSHFIWINYPKVDSFTYDADPSIGASIFGLVS
jgi:hypothetical protein